MSDEIPTETPAVKKNKGGRPKRIAANVQQAVTAQGFTPTMEQWGQLIEALRGNKEADIEAAATINARAMKKALRPENEIAPDVSVYNPTGEPRVRPSQIYMLARYPICDPGNSDTTTRTEIELLNALRPGAYTVTKSDGMDVQVLVKTEKDSAERPYKTTLFADGKGIQDDEQRNNWPSLIQILTQMITGERPEQSYARYQAIIDRLTAENTALKAASAA